MRFRIPQDWVYEFSEKLLREVGISSEIIETDLESIVYEAGERGWDEDEDSNFFYVYFDLD